MKDKIIDRAFLEQMRKELTDTLEEYLASKDLKLTIGSIRYNGTEIKTSISFMVDSPETREKLSRSLGFDRNIINEMFIYNNKVYTVMDIMPNRRKYPILAKDILGKEWGFPKKVIPLVMLDPKK